MLLVMTSFILECSRCQSHCVQTITNIPTSQYNCADAHRRCRCPVIVFTAQLTPDDPDWHLLMKLLVRRCRLNVKKKKSFQKRSGCYDRRFFRPVLLLLVYGPPCVIHLTFVTTFSAPTHQADLKRPWNPRCPHQRKKLHGESGLCLNPTWMSQELCNVHEITL